MPRKDPNYTRLSAQMNIYVCISVAAAALEFAHDAAKGFHALLGRCIFPLYKLCILLDWCVLIMRLKSATFSQRQNSHSTFLTFLIIKISSERILIKIKSMKGRLDQAYSFMRINYSFQIRSSDKFGSPPISFLRHYNSPA
jgi:hypothetical protein